MREAISTQFFKQTTNSELPLYFREKHQLITYILDYEKYLNDPYNLVFRDNVMLPYIQVQIQRVESESCENFIDRPGVGGFYEGETCMYSSSKEKLKKDDFDGYSYQETFGIITTKFSSLLDAGNRKDILIFKIDEEGKYITETDKNGVKHKISTWSNSLKREVFRRYDIG